MGFLGGSKLDGMPIYKTLGKKSYRLYSINPIKVNLCDSSQEGFCMDNRLIDGQNKVGWDLQTCN